MVCSDQHLIDEVLSAYTNLLPGKRVKICQILVVATGRSCLTISFIICIITCAVASYVHYMISFKICRQRWCQIRGLGTDAAHHARILYSSACVAHPACNLGIRIMPIQAQPLYLFTELSDYHKYCQTPHYKKWMNK